MFHHKKKLCYIAYPKSASSSLRKHLLKYGFTKAIGNNGHASVKEVLDKGNYVDYTFFTAFRNPYDHFISAYKHAFYGWKGKIEEYPKLISSVNDYIEYLEKVWVSHPYNFQFYLSDKNDNIKIKRFIDMDNFNVNFKKFCQDYGFKYSPIPIINVSNHSVKLTKQQKKRIIKLYKNNIEIHTSVNNANNVK